MKKLKSKNSKITKLFHLLVSFVLAVFILLVLVNLSNLLFESKLSGKILYKSPVVGKLELVKCQIRDDFYVLSRSICAKIQNDELLKSEDNNFISTIQYEKYEPEIKTQYVDDGREWGVTYKEDDLISVSKFGADEAMSTTEELNQAMNSYRQRRGLSTLNHDQQICDFAQTRANQNFEKGELDRHEGFEPLFNEQNMFREMGEVVFGGNQPVSGVHIVEWGWDQSLTGHKEAITDPRWSDGCAGISGYFAVYVFGKR